MRCGTAVLEAGKERGQSKAVMAQCSPWTQKISLPVTVVNRFGSCTFFFAGRSEWAAAGGVGKNRGGLIFSSIPNAVTCLPCPVYNQHWQLPSRFWQVGWTARQRQQGIQMRGWFNEKPNFEVSFQKLQL